MAYAFNDDKSKLRIDNTWTKIKTGLYCRKVLDNVQVWSDCDVRYEKGQYGGYHGLLGVLPSGFRPNNKIWAQIKAPFELGNNIVLGTIIIEVDGTMNIRLSTTGESSYAITAGFYRYFEFPCTVPIDE